MRAAGDRGVVGHFELLAPLGLFLGEEFVALIFVGEPMLVPPDIDVVAR